MGQMYYKTTAGELIAIGTPVGPIQEGTDPATGNNGYFFYDADAPDVTAMTLLASTTDNGVPRFDGTGGLLQTSAVTISDTGELAGAVIPASQIKAEAWTSWTPAVTATGGVTLTGATGNYLQVGKLVIGWGYWGVTYANRNGGYYTLSLPVPPKQQTYLAPIGQVRVSRSDTTQVLYYYLQLMSSSNTCHAFTPGALNAWSDPGQLGSGTVPNATMYCVYTFTYEAA